MSSIWQNFLFPSVKYLGLQNHVRQLLGAPRMTGKQACAMSTQPTKNLSLSFRDIEEQIFGMWPVYGS